MIYGKLTNIPRDQVAFADEGIQYSFSGITLPSLPWISVISKVRDRVKQLEFSPNFCLVNKYNDGSNSIGEHQDDEKQLNPRAPIAGVSFGASKNKREYY